MDLKKIYISKQILTPKNKVCIQSKICIKNTFCKEDFGPENCFSLTKILRVEWNRGTRNSYVPKNIESKMILFLWTAFVQKIVWFKCN